jgi:hypothetical protein
LYAAIGDLARQRDYLCGRTLRENLGEMHPQLTLSGLAGSGKLRALRLKTAPDRLRHTG